jgi:O-antigen/teichoic acid export membrane protein
MTTVKQESTSLTIRATWLMIAKTVGYAFSIALPLILVRRLNQEEFGLYKQVFLIVSSAVLVLPLGFHMSAYYYLPRESERKGQIVLNILLVYVVVIGAACLAILLYPSVLTTILGAHELTAHAPLVAFVVLTWGCSSFLETVVVANQEIRLATFFIIAANVSKVIFIVGAVLVFGTFKALLYGAIVQGVLQLAALLIYVALRFGKAWQNYDKTLLRAQLSYALPLGVAATILQFHLMLDSMIVSKRLGTAALAIYAIGCFNIPLFFLISDAVGSVMIPRVSFLQKEGARREIIELLARMIRKLSAIALPLYAFLLVVGQPFIVLLFTTRYLASWPIFAINLAQIPLSVLTSAYDPVLRAYAEERYFLLRVRMVMMIFLALALWYGTASYGLIGAVTIVLTASIIERIILSVKVGHLLGVQWRDWGLFKDVGKILIATVMASCLTLVARRLMAGSNLFVLLTVCGAIFSMCYALGLLLLGLLTTQERELIRQRSASLRHYLVRRRAQASLTEG